MNMTAKKITAYASATVGALVSFVAINLLLTIEPIAQWLDNPLDSLSMSTTKVVISTTVKMMAIFFTWSFIFGLFNLPSKETDKTEQ